MYGYIVGIIDVWLFINVAPTYFVGRGGEGGGRGVLDLSVCIQTEVQRTQVDDECSKPAATAENACKPAGQPVSVSTGVVRTNTTSRAQGSGCLGGGVRGKGGQEEDPGSITKGCVNANLAKILMTQCFKCHF